MYLRVLRDFVVNILTFLNTLSSYYYFNNIGLKFSALPTYRHLRRVVMQQLSRLFQTIHHW
jgi:hypothetical protein